ncbi:MFS-type transporter SLC18B1-like [Schistocerca gregaria]|uniref:MFS-type transporter SLC18B1-like n=1 Tax=Schistocerca gregaria TaxID=7010 RepID=UPI00211F236A|nr:MFS-type transporter SLC18B1-like [Schistocerca gregaria]
MASFDISVLYSDVYGVTSEISVGTDESDDLEGNSDRDSDSLGSEKNFNFNGCGAMIGRNVAHSADATLVTMDTTSREFDSHWRREIIRTEESGNVRKYIRSQSLSTFQQVKYTAGEIRCIRDRLLLAHKSSRSGSLRNFTRMQKLTLTSLALVDFTSFCSMSIMAPFFPKEAAQKGMSDTISGLVFSFYALVMFISSPVFGKILPLTGAKFLFMTGMFVAGSCNFLFGLLARIDSYTIFTMYCFLVRGMEALGASAYATASYVFVVEVFPDTIGTVLGILETFVGMGMSIGPAVGGLLYSIGGFELPFYSLGILMVATVPINFCLLPSTGAGSINKHTGSLLHLVKLPSVIVISLVIVVVSNTWGFLDPTLEPHLREFNLSAEEVGLIFLLFSALYGIFSPIWGWLADRVNNHWSMMVWGLLACSLGLLLLGPSPLLPFLNKSLWLVLVALSILGVSVALTLMPTFQGVLESAIEGGCSDELSTYSMVAGVWSCMYSLGEVMGPSVGGTVMEYYGFPICSTVMAGLSLLLAVVTLVYFSVKHTQQHHTREQSTDSGISENYESENSPLLAGAEAGDRISDHTYTRERAQFYGESSEGNEATDSCRTVSVTAGGACEV